MCSRSLAKILMKDPLDSSLLLFTKCQYFIWCMHLTECDVKDPVEEEYFVNAFLMEAFWYKKITSRVTS